MVWGNLMTAKRGLIPNSRSHPANLTRLLYLNLLVSAGLKPSLAPTAHSAVLMFRMSRRVCVSEPLLTGHSDRALVYSTWLYNSLTVIFVCSFIQALK